jgi:hypothetical protein
MDIEIGSNLYRNTDGAVEIEGVPQLMLALRRPGGPLLVNFVLYNNVGRVVAKVVDSTIAFNERRAYELTKLPTGLVLTHVESGKVVLQVELKENGRVTVQNGEFLTVKGHLLEISPVEWRVEKRRMSGGDTDLKGGVVVIG